MEGSKEERSKFTRPCLSCPLSIYLSFCLYVFLSPFQSKSETEERRNGKEERKIDRGREEKKGVVKFIPPCTLPPTGLPPSFPTPPLFDVDRSHFLLFLPFLPFAPGAICGFSIFYSRFVYFRFFDF